MSAEKKDPAEIEKKLKRAITRMQSEYITYSKRHMIATKHGDLRGMSEAAQVAEDYHNAIVCMKAVLDAMIKQEEAKEKSNEQKDQ